MSRGFGTFAHLGIGLFLLALGVFAQPASAEVKFVGRVSVPADTLDLAEPSGEARNAFRLGGFGAFEYLGQGNQYLLVPDRGPDDGVNEFTCRMQTAEILVAPQADPPVTIRWLSTRLLRDEAGQRLVGSANVFDTGRPDGGRRFDPEGARVIGSRIFLSDEYGPTLAEFDASGRRQRIFTLPAYFGIRKPSAVRGEENLLNKVGRISNRGMESLAVSPDGLKLYGALQSALIQDAIPGDMGRLYGRHTRIIEIDLSTGGQRQFAYPLADVKNGVSEILAVGRSQLLVLERDDRSGVEAQYKRVVRIDLDKASDISRFEQLPADELPRGVRPVERREFLDLLDARHGLAGSMLPEKFEGMTFGPNLPDGRHLLLISVDNDFKLDAPSQIFAFAFTKSDLPELAWHYRIAAELGSGR